MEDKYFLKGKLEGNYPYPKKDIAEYDLSYCYEKVLEKIEQYNKAHYEFPNITKPKLTANYEIIYEYFTSKKIDNVSKFVQIKLDKEQEIQELYDDIIIGVKLLTFEEYDYLVECLLKGRSENKVIEKLKSSRFLLDKIKESFIVKMAIALNVVKKRES